MKMQEMWLKKSLTCSSGKKHSSDLLIFLPSCSKSDLHHMGKGAERASDSEKVGSTTCWEGPGRVSQGAASLRRSWEGPRRSLESF